MNEPNAMYHPHPVHPLLDHNAPIRGRPICRKGKQFIDPGTAWASLYTRTSTYFSVESAMHATTTEFGRMGNEKEPIPQIEASTRSSALPNFSIGPLSSDRRKSEPASTDRHYELVIFSPNSRARRPIVSWLEGIEHCLRCTGHVESLLEYPDFRVTRQ